MTSDQGIKNVLALLVIKYFKFFILAIIIIVLAIGWVAVIRPKYENFKATGILTHKSILEKNSNKKNYLASLEELDLQYSQINFAKISRLKNIDFCY